MQIKAQIENTASEYDKEKLQERLAKLSGGVAVIKVGAATETEMKEKKDRIEDALHATRAAVEEGIVAGGGVALLRAQEVVNKLKLEGDEQLGVQIIARALEEPMRIIASNAGYEGSVIVNRVHQEKGNTGFDAKTGEYVDMVESGIIDPAKVVRSALQNASSIAVFFLPQKLSFLRFLKRKKQQLMVDMVVEVWACQTCTKFISYTEGSLIGAFFFWRVSFKNCTSESFAKS